MALAVAELTETVAGSLAGCARANPVVNPTSAMQRVQRSRVTGSF
jgi:hypothetical protein